LNLFLLIYENNEYKDVSGYRVVVDVGYVKDYGYDESGKIILIRIKDKLYIAEYTPEEVSE